MLEILSYKFELWKLQNEKKKNRKYFEKLIDKAKKEDKPREELDELHRDEMTIEDRIDDYIAQTQYQVLVAQAEKYLIPTPKYITRNGIQNGIWEKSDITGGWRLSQNALSELKKEVQQEQKYQREHLQGWLVLLIGFIGALIGLLSVWKSN